MNTRLKSRRKEPTAVHTKGHKPRLNLDKGAILKLLDSLNMNLHLTNTVKNLYNSIVQTK